MNIIFRYLEICFFKASPADVISSHWIMKLTLLAYFMIGVAISRIDQSWDISLFSSLTDLLMMILFTWLLLRLRGFDPRFQQTVTALAGAGSCLGIIGIPVVYFFKQVSVNEPSQLSGLAMLMMIGLMLWSLMVTAHIFRTSLEIKPSSAVLLTISYTILSLIMVGLVVSGIA